MTAQQHRFDDAFLQFDEVMTCDAVYYDSLPFHETGCLGAAISVGRLDVVNVRGCGNVRVYHLVCVEYASQPFPLHPKITKIK